MPLVHAANLPNAPARNVVQVGAASPSFGARDLSRRPFPGAMSADRAAMTFVHLSLDETRLLDLRACLGAHPAAREGDAR